MRKKLLLIIPALLMACGAPVAPEVVAKRFYEECERGRQDGPAVVQSSIFNMLSEASQAHLEEQANALNESLELERPLHPAGCLVFQVFEGQRRSFDARRVADGTGRVRLEVTSGDSIRHLELVREGDWKIDLQTTLSLNQTAPASP